MPEIKNTFLGGKMNKDLDDRLLPEGEYRDAQNIEVLKPDGSNVGVIQNAAGNTIAHTTLGLSSDVDVIGTYFDEKNKHIYWFVTDNNDLSATDWYIDNGLTDPRFHAIYYYDANPSSATFKTAKAIVTGRFLKFSKKYKITGVAMIDDLLFWTDNKNQPRKINVVKAIEDTSFYNNELKISLAKYAPFTPVVFMTENDIAGTSTMSNDAALENDYIEEEFVRFSYRYKFNDNEYSVLAPFTQIAFQHSYKSGSEYGTFNEAAEARAYQSTELDGMINHVNTAVLGIDLPSINPNADFEIKEVEIIIKESDSTVARIVETKTLTDADISSTFYTYTYKSDTPQETLPEDQITRVFDNVPTKAKALDIVGNRLVFGNYSQNITVPALDYTVSFGAKTTQTFTGDGSDTTFTLTLKSPTRGSTSIPPTNTNQFVVYINDVLLDSTNYAYDGTTGVITFNTAPADGAAITVTLVNHEYPDSSLKQRRTYQVGVVLADIFGRQSPVILPSTASNSIITVPARTTANEFNSWVGDNLKITFNAQSGKLIPDTDVYSNELNSGVYSTYNPYGWYSYKIVVKQLEQEYYNVYTPGATVVDNNSYITLFGDNINKIPRLMETISAENSIARSDTVLFPKVINTAFYTTTTTTTGTRSSTTGGKTITSAAMVFACNQYQIFNRHASSDKDFKYTPCTSAISNQTDLTNAATTVTLGARKKQVVWSLTFPDLTANADVGFIEVTQLTFNSVSDANSNTGFGAAEVTDPSSGQIAKTIAYNSEKRIQSLSAEDEIPITGIGKLSDFSSININTVQEYSRSSSLTDDAGGPFYQRENNHLIAQLPPYGETSSDSDLHGVRMLFTDDTASDNAAFPALGVTSYIKRGKYIDLAVFETKPIESEINIYYETSTTGLINELNALETGLFSAASVTVSDFAITEEGTITAPTINVGSLQSVNYVNSTTDAGETVGFDYFAVSTNTTRTAQLTITAPSGYTNAGQNIIMSTTAVQPATSGLSTTVPLFSDLSLTSIASTSSSAATFTVSATISSNGNATVTARGFRIGSTNVFANATEVAVGGGTGTFTTTKNDATINTLFYVWAYATNSQGVNIQGPIQVTTPALGLFQVSDWTGSISVAHTGAVTTVAGNSPEVLYAPSGGVAANSSNSNTVSVTLGKSDGDADSYTANENTIRIQIPTSGYSNSASSDYLYTAVRTVTQPAAPASVTYTVPLHAIPTGFSIADDAVFTQGTIQQGTLNSVALSGNALTNGAATNLATVTNATLRALTLNITPGGSFTNSSAADFIYNIVQPSIQPTLTTGSIPTQSTVITGSTDIDLRNYFTNGKFFEITSNSATASKISATIVSGYILRLTGQGSCNDITGTTSAGSIVVAAFNEKATVDGSVAGSTASTSVVEKGDAFVSATVALNVTACAQNATLTMSFNPSGSTLDSCTVDGGTGATSETETYAVGAIGTSFTNKMQFTIAKSGTNLATNMINVSTSSGFSTVLTDNGDTITVGFSGTYPNQSVNGNINYTFTLNISTVASYISAIQLNMTNAGYEIAGNGILSVSGTPSNSQADMDSKTITASNNGTFTGNPIIYYSNQTPSGNNYIHVTSHTSGEPFIITQPSANGNSSFTITGTSKILSSDTSGSANVYLSPTTTTNPSIDSIQFNGGQTTHYSVNGVVSPISVAIAGEGNISLSLSSSGNNIASLSASSGNGNFSVNINLSGANATGSLTLTATDENGDTLSETITLQQNSMGLNEGIAAWFISSAQTTSTNACNVSDGSLTTQIYGNYDAGTQNNVGAYFHTTDESAILNGTGAPNTSYTQTAVFAGGNSYYKGRRGYFNGSAYIPLSSSNRWALQFDNDGKITSVSLCS
jgi:hypothetical protein